MIYFLNVLERLKDLDENIQSLDEQTIQQTLDRLGKKQVTTSSVYKVFADGKVSLAF